MWKALHVRRGDADGSNHVRAAALHAPRYERIIDRRDAKLRDGRARGLRHSAGCVSSLRMHNNNATHYCTLSRACHRSMPASFMAARKLTSAMSLP